MRKISRLLPFLFILPLITCNKADLCDGRCDPLFPEVNFMLVNSAGQNLTCGTAKQYSLDKVRLTALSGGTTIEIPLGYTGDSSLSVTNIVFSVALYSQVYLSLNNVKTDSFQLAYEHRDGRVQCCPDYEALISLKLNNVLTPYVFPGTSDLVKIVK